MNKLMIFIFLLYGSSFLYAFPDAQESKTILNNINQELNLEKEKAQKSLESLEDFVEWLAKVFDWGNKNSRAFIVALICILVLLVTLIVLLVVRNISQKKKTISASKTSDDFNMDILPSKNVLTAAEEAAAAGSWSEAVILIYLDCLRYFEVNHHLSMTNSDLLSTLVDSKKIQSFRTLSSHEEKISFANISAQESDYAEAKASADAFKSVAKL